MRFDEQAIELSPEEKLIVSEIDSRLLVLKLNKQFGAITNEYLKIADEIKSGVRTHPLLASGRVETARLQIWAMKECTEAIRRVWTSVWEQQGNVKTARFVRFVFKLISISIEHSRKAGISAINQLVHGERNRQLQLNRLEQAALNLRSETYQDLEVEARELEHEQRIAKVNPPAKSASAATRMLDGATSPAAENLKKRTRSKSRDQQTREELMLPVLKKGHDGVRYCLDMDRGRVPPLKRWIQQQWPGSYATAYRDPVWRKRLQDDKYKVRRRLVKAGRLTPPLALKAKSE